MATPEQDRHLRSGSSGGPRQRRAGCRVSGDRPRDVIGTAPVGALNDDLRVACLSALHLSPQACLEFAAKHTWEASALAFVENITNVRTFDANENALQFAVKRPRFVA
jgi:hypothetical protein